MGYHFVCSAQQKLWLVNKWSCMYGNDVDVHLFDIDFHLTCSKVMFNVDFLYHLHCEVPLCVQRPAKVRHKKIMPCELEPTTLWLWVMYPNHCTMSLFVDIWKAGAFAWSLLQICVDRSQYQENICWSINMMLLVKTSDEGNNMDCMNK